MNAYGGVLANVYPSQDELVSQGIGLVKRIACHLAARLPSSVEIDDLMQSGMIGLLEAAGNFDASRGASFDTYAGIRIRGAMLDEVRKLDWTPRSVHQKIRQVTQAMHAIESRTGRAAEAREVAADLKITLDEYHGILQDAAGCRLFSLEESVEHGEHGRGLPDSDAETPEQTFGRAQFRAQLADAIRRLPERERLVLSLYYERELNLKEIGAVLEVSESRICQIHGQALVRLRSMMER
ncbi:MAG: RNA polymerase sigma factor FliA [Woeseiaceae bacterium]